MRILKQIHSWLDCWENWVAALMTAGILCSMKLKKKLLIFQSELYNIITEGVISNKLVRKS